MESALRVEVGNMLLICSHWMYLSYEEYSPFGQFDKNEYLKGSIGAISQTVVARLGETRRCVSILS
jgi:hypothetical protein